MFKNCEKFLSGKKETTLIELIPILFLYVHFFWWEVPIKLSDAELLEQAVLTLHIFPGIDIEEEVLN